MSSLKPVKRANLSSWEAFLLSYLKTSLPRPVIHKI